MPAYRAADYAFLERLETNYVLPETPVMAAPVRAAEPDPRGRQDSTVGYRGVRSLIEEFPRATYAVIDMAGHHVGRIERSAVFQALVGDWLERMQATSP